MPGAGSASTEMPTRIWLAESAVRDLEAVRAWYVSQSAPDAGERLIREIVAPLNQLAELPESGRIVPEFDQRWLRELIRPPFRIVYRVEPGRVRVVRVWRTDRLMADRPDETADRDSSGVGRHLAARRKPG